jgi:hypothetical protein
MGNQGHSSDDARLINEWIAAGVIGSVHEVHVWTNRPIWAQGLLQPAPVPEDPLQATTVALQAAKVENASLREVLSSISVDNDEARKEIVHITLGCLKIKAFHVK